MCKGLFNYKQSDEMLASMVVAILVFLHNAFPVTSYGPVPKTHSRMDWSIFCLILAACALYISVIVGMHHDLFTVRNGISTCK